MHLPDHYLDPTTCATTALVSGAAVVYAVRQLRTESRDRLQMLGAVSAAIFAAQMVNFPIASGTSGHLMGGALAAILLGPWTGLLAIALVLAVQALIFGDGGIAALGANIFNMGIIAALGGGFAYRLGRIWFAKLNDSAAIPLAAAVAGWTTVVVAALACSVQMAIAGTFVLNDVLFSMVGVHAMIGLSEGLITAGAVGLLHQFSPGLFADASQSRIQSSNESVYQSPVRRVTWTVMAFAVGTAILLSPLASASPDGLESVVEPMAANLDPQPLLTFGTVAISSVFSDYALPGIELPAVATAAAGLLGLLIVLALGTLLSLLQRRNLANQRTT